MKLALSLLALLMTIPSAAWGGQVLYLASTDDRSIVAYEVDEETGRLNERFYTELPGNAGPLAFSPDAEMVYAAQTGLEGGRAGVSTLRRSANGSLKLLATATIASRAPYIRADKSGRFLLAAHYGAGEVTVYRIVDGICTDQLTDRRVTKRTAHCIELDPSGRFAFVPHTEPNQVFQFALTDEGRLLPNDPPVVEGPEEGHRYHAPRHYAHHPQLEVAYTSNEAGGGITAWKFDPRRGTLSQLQTLCTLPPDYQGDSAAADIHLTPDGRFAYVSNRDTTNRPDGQAMQDTLAAIALDPQSGRMKVAGHFSTTHFPRSFCLDLTGRYLYAAGQQSDELVAYRIDPPTGRLTEIARYETGGAPIWVMCGKATL